MPSSKERLDEVLAVLPSEGITYRQMMGEYIIYYNGKVVGGIYDDRFLVKLAKAARKLLPDAPLELPYEGAREMILVEDLSSDVFLKDLIVSIWDELYAKKSEKGYHR